MRIAVLFDGAGLARLGLERAGFDCVGVEIDPVAHYLSTSVGSGRCVLADALTFDLSGFDAVWASPPCQVRSKLRVSAPANVFGQVDLVAWSLALRERIPFVWVENVFGHADNEWGRKWNAAQFTTPPIQQRKRIIGGRYVVPVAHRPFAHRYAGVCKCVTATEYQGHARDWQRASAFYGRRLTLAECGYHQGFDVPPQWREVPPGWKPREWEKRLYRAVGNGVPVYMAQAFGDALRRYLDGELSNAWICQ